MEISEIQLAISKYFDVMFECDLEKFDQVFHPSCSLFTADEVDLVIKPFGEYRREMSTRIPPKSMNQTRERERIVKIDFLSRRMALVQVQVQIHDKVFVDNLNVTKVGHQWMVVAKIYSLLAVV